MPFSHNNVFFQYSLGLIFYVKMKIVKSFQKKGQRFFMSDFNREMRRKDREMPRDFGLHVIDKATYGTMAIPDKPYTYSVPLSIARYENTLYFHSAPAGKKTELFDQEPLVCVSFVGDVEVPENYTNEELRELLKDPKQWSMLARNVFTTQYESAMVYGKVHQVSDEEEIKLALRTIAQKFTPDKMEFVEKAIEAGIHRVRIYAVSIDHVTAKRKKYDEEGVEMKFQRGWREN